MYKRIVLDNGLTLIMDRRASAKKVVLTVGPRIGSVHEDDENAGVNHFIEHMLFKSNPFRDTRQIEEDLEDGGAEMNAFSDHTDMFFYIKSLPSKIPQIIEIIFQAAVNLNFNRREFSLEKKNILSEISLYQEQPMAYSFDELFFPTLFKNSLLARSIAGSPKTIRTMKIEDLIEFKERWYTPDRMIVLACGKFDEEEVENGIKSTFGTLTRGEYKTEEFKPRIKNKRTELFKEADNIDHAYLHIGYIVPGMVSRSINKLRVASSVLGGGFSSRFWHEFRDKRGLGYSVDCGVGGIKNVGIFSVSFTIFEPTERKIRMVESIALKEFSRLKNELVEEKELQRAKDLIISGYYDEIERIESLALDMLEAEILGIPYGRFRKFPINIQKVSAEEVMLCAQKYFTDKYTLTALIPKGMGQ